MSENQEQDDISKKSTSKNTAKRDSTDSKRNGRDGSGDSDNDSSEERHRSVFLEECFIELADAWLERRGKELLIGVFQHSMESNKKSPRRNAKRTTTRSKSTPKKKARLTKCLGDRKEISISSDESEDHYPELDEQEFIKSILTK